MSNLTYLWSNGMVDSIAKKVAEEPMEMVDEGDYEYLPKRRPQHVIDEERVDEAILERHDQRQRDMYDDPDMNWSGLR